MPHCGTVSVAGSVKAASSTVQPQASSNAAQHQSTRTPHKHSTRRPASALQQGNGKEENTLVPSANKREEKKNKATGVSAIPAVTKLHHLEPLCAFWVFLHPAHVRLSSFASLYYTFFVCFFSFISAHCRSMPFYAPPLKISGKKMMQPATTKPQKERSIENRADSDPSRHRFSFQARLGKDQHYRLAVH